MWGAVRRALYLDRARDPVEDYSAELERLRALTVDVEAVQRNVSGEALEALLAEELVWSSPTVADIVARFQRVYCELCDARFPLLRPDADRFAAYVAYVRDTGLGLEDYTDHVLLNNASLLGQLERLSQQLRNIPDNARPIAHLALDLVMSACLVPSACLFVRGKHDVHLHFDYQGEVARTWIQSVPCELVSEVVKELRLFAGSIGALKGSVLLSHLQWDAYQTQSVPQRLAQLTLVNVANPLRSAMASDELVCRVVASPQLLRWIVSGSHMDEQYWLNTCEVSAYNNAFTARMITVAHCMVITRTISADLRRNVVANLSVSDPWTGSLWRCDMRSIRAHCEATLDAADRQLETLTRRAHRALDQGSDMRELHAILMEWHRLTQYLSSIYYPAEPVVLTRKLLSENWQLSAKIISVPCALATLLPWQPLVWRRNDGAPGRYERGSGWFMWRDKLTTLQHAHLKDLSRSMAAMDDARVEAVLSEVWLLALHYGGLLFASKEHIWSVVVGHLNVLYAICMPGKGRQFLVGDPEIRQFKWLSFADARNMIISPTVEFDFFDV